MAYLRNRYENDSSQHYSTQEPSLHQTSLRERSQPLGHIHVKGQLNLRLPALRETNINNAKSAEFVYGSGSPNALDVGETRFLMLDWSQDDPVFVYRNAMQRTKPSTSNKPSMNNIFAEVTPTLFASGNGMDLSKIKTVEIKGKSYLDQEHFEDGLLFAGWATHNVSYRSPGTTASIAICGLRTVWIAGTDGDWGDRFGWYWPNINKSIRNSEAQYERPLNDRPREKIMARIERMDPSDVVRMPQRALTAAFTLEKTDTKKGVFAENYNPYQAFVDMNGSRSDNKYISANDIMVARIALFAQWCAILGGEAVLSKMPSPVTSTVQTTQAVASTVQTVVPTQPTQIRTLATDASEAATDASEAATDASEAATDASEAASEAATDATQAATDATQAATDATQAATDATQTAQILQTATAANVAGSTQITVQILQTATAAKTRADAAKTRADDAKTRADAAKTRADDAKTRADDAKTRADNVNTRIRAVNLATSPVAPPPTLSSTATGAPAPPVAVIVPSALATVAIVPSVLATAAIVTPAADKAADAKSRLITSARILGISTDKSSIGVLSNDEMRNLLGNAVKGLFTTTDLQAKYKTPVENLESVQNNAAVALFAALNSAAQHYNDRCVGRLVQRGFAWGKADIHT